MFGSAVLSLLAELGVVNDPWASDPDAAKRFCASTRRQLKGAAADRANVDQAYEDLALSTTITKETFRSFVNTLLEVETAALKQWESSVREGVKETHALLQTHDPTANYDNIEALSNADASVSAHWAKAGAASKLRSLKRWSSRPFRFARLPLFSNLKDNNTC